MISARKTVNNFRVQHSSVVGALGCLLPEVGKMKIVYLLPLSLPSTAHVSDIAYLKKR
jgi:hypothetical protein